MAISLTINGIRENEDNKTAYFTLTVDSKEFKFHADMPLDADPKEWLNERRQKIKELIESKMARGTFTNRHPKWIEALAEIDAISSLSDAKTFLKKLVMYLGR